MTTTSAVVMSDHPLVELISWVKDSILNIRTEGTIHFLVNTPRYYLKWWENLYSEAPQHILIETGLIIFIIWLVFIRKTIDPNKPAKIKKLSESEMQWLVDTWTPEPFVPKLNDKQRVLSRNEMIVEKYEGNILSIQGIERQVINFCSFDFLGMSSNPSITQIARDALEKYGCGSCGPRGFYGTIDQHLFFEQAMAKFMGTEEAICYSDGASAVTSTIPAFSKKGDLLIIDNACSEAILTGANLSRSTVQYFKHNDMKDLENILQSISDEDRRRRRDASQQRRFIVVEGLYRNIGDLCNLPEIMVLKKKYCYRLIIDESLSFGAIGKSGRGVTDHFGIDIKEVEIIDIGVDTSLASVGGVCIGTREIVDHQRLSGAGYCFSASNPPFLSAAATKSLSLIESCPQLLRSLHDLSSTLYQGLCQLESKGLTLLTRSPSPLNHLCLKNPPSDRMTEEILIMAFANECARRGVGLCASKFSIARNTHLRPSIRICASTLLTSKQIETAIKVLEEVASELIQQ